MQYISYYQCPLGKMLLTSQGTGLTGAWIDGAKYSAGYLERQQEQLELPEFAQAKEWLNIYFSGKMPKAVPPLDLKGSAFQLAVWEILQKIPYGRTVTYGEIASEIAKKRGISRMSAQAVGGAVGRNKISIIVPCHRVIGADGSLTGYAGGLDKKRFLLALEGAIDTEDKSKKQEV